MTSNAFLAILALLFTTVATAAEKPNLLLILVDDLGYGDLSCYGATDLQTPHLDKLAAEGMTLPSFYANCPVCSPTRAAILSGRYPELVGVPGVVRTHPENNWGYLSPDALLLPQILKGVGYHTALVGKWHLGLREETHPANRGFDHVHGFLGDMMDDYYKHQRHGIDYMVLGKRLLPPEERVGHATDLFSHWASDYLRERTAEENANQPWFLYLAYNAPHTPIQPPADWLKKVREREPGIANNRARLVALIEHMDHGIGNVLKTLDETGQRDNTLVVFTSDNGGHVWAGATNGPHRGGKQDMYEGGLKVCSFARWPGKIAPGTRSDRRGLTMDLYPSFAAAAGATIDHNIDGVDILPTLLGEDQGPDTRTVFFTRREGNLRYMGESAWACIDGDHKLVKNSPQGPWELFNLNDDPLETTDLSKTNKKAFNTIAERMRRHIQRGGRIPWQK